MNKKTEFQLDVLTDKLTPIEGTRLAIDEYQAVFVQVGMGDFTQGFADQARHAHELVSFDGMTPAEVADAIQKINAKGATSGLKRLETLLSEFIGY
jgi:hypothetical protein